MEDNTKFDKACKLCGNLRTQTYFGRTFTGCCCGMVKTECLLNERIRWQKLNDKT